jgi:hypothetical protein
VVTQSDDADSGGRRELLLKASGAVLAAGAAVLLEACGGSSSPPKIQVHKVPPKLPAEDIGLLRPALDLEYRGVAAYTASFPLLHAFDARTAKRFLQQELDSIENQQVSYYVDVIPKLAPGPVRALVASILANDAQHVSMLRVILGRDPVPSAFVKGQK